ncbi:DNA ligase-associated metallophosphoesterase [Mitsuaria sp. BK045]|uniref:ligase-associated DNA damage response endonuclease PdeM n=1 Tax=unclassified Roseateles TaxID=2626991 RepID=UPI00161F45B0|nr:MULTISPECIES: ligase-associated DNA damage response endonuclease PdeM [unclassified Roseateles]MBB3292711.1 DNA ligase-associated metallophosphoesterase [Mitsuaria sp. BK041]MBB3361928.1 DNA ligase-associated metallophosphoesterase [Mitsuaria sp. BK045]
MTPDIDAPAGALATTLAGERVWLLPERALWWPAARTVFVADVHLGKAASFRALGQPVPAGTTRDNLDRLSTLVDGVRAARLVVLGDFLHAAAARQAGVLDPAHRWRERHAGLDCLLIRGNHDSHAGDPPATLRFELADEPHRLGPFAACHHPRRVAQAYVLAGHLHPAMTLHGRAHERQRLPCFCEVEGLMILPAFGAFTGTTVEGLPPGARCHAVGGGAVWADPHP